MRLSVFCHSQGSTSDTITSLKSAASQAGAVHIAEHGLRFLRRLQRLAKDAINQAQRSPLAFDVPCCTPPAFGRYAASALKGLLPVSPLAWCVQMDEDLIGKASRLSRKVDPPICSKLCMERYLCAAYAEYETEVHHRTGFMIACTMLWYEKKIYIYI